jgi:hypothetical protein
MPTERVMPLKMHSDADGRTLLAWAGVERILRFHARNGEIHNVDSRLRM